MIVGYSFQFDCIGGDYTLQSIVRVLPWWIFFCFLKIELVYTTISLWDRPKFGLGRV